MRIHISQHLGVECGAATDEIGILSSAAGPSGESGAAPACGSLKNWVPGVESGGNRIVTYWNREWVRMPESTSCLRNWKGARRDDSTFGPAEREGSDEDDTFTGLLGQGLADSTFGEAQYNNGSW
jgi:hypothetical protein